MTVGCSRAKLRNLVPDRTFLSHIGDTGGVHWRKMSKNGIFGVKIYNYSGSNLFKSWVPSQNFEGDSPASWFAVAAT